MVTSIAVREDTLQMLKQHQARFKTKTHDETIRALFIKHRQGIVLSHESMFGKLKTKKEFVREELDRFA